MPKKITQFSQSEYSRILDELGARVRNFTQAQCTDILMERGLEYHPAKDAAYVYLHHGNDLSITKDGTRETYAKILNAFGARKKTWKECIDHLKSHGFSYGQAKNAVHKYRQARHLIKA